MEHYTFFRRTKSLSRCVGFILQKYISRRLYKVFCLVENVLLFVVVVLVTHPIRWCGNETVVAIRWYGNGTVAAIQLN